MKIPLGFINQEYNFTTIIGFNFQFYAERELHAAASNKKIKFICLHKESLIFPGELNAYKEMLKKLGNILVKKYLFIMNILEKQLFPLNLLILENRIDWYATSRFLLSHKKEKIIKPKKGFF